MLGWKWLNDKILDRSKLRRAERNLEEVKAVSRRRIAEARKNTSSQLDLQNLLAERDHEESLAWEWLDTILSDQLLKEVRRRPIEIPSITNSNFWYESNELDWILTPYGRRQLSRLLRIDRRYEWNLRFQAATVLTGVLGTAIGFTTVLYQCG